MIIVSYSENLIDSSVTNRFFPALAEGDDGVPGGLSFDGGHAAVFGGREDEGAATLETNDQVVVGNAAEDFDVGPDRLRIGSRERPSPMIIRGRRDPHVDGEAGAISVKKAGRAVAVASKHWIVAYDDAVELGAGIGDHGIEPAESSPEGAGGGWDEGQERSVDR